MPYNWLHSSQPQIHQLNRLSHGNIPGCSNNETHRKLSLQMIIRKGSASFYLRDEWSMIYFQMITMQLTKFLETNLRLSNKQYRPALSYKVATRDVIFKCKLIKYKTFSLSQKVLLESTDTLSFPLSQLPSVLTLSLLPISRYIYVCYYSM